MRGRRTSTCEIINKSSKSNNICYIDSDIVFSCEKTEYVLAGSRRFAGMQCPYAVEVCGKFQEMLGRK